MKHVKWIFPFLKSYSEKKKLAIDLKGIAPNYLVLSIILTLLSTFDLYAQFTPGRLVVVQTSGSVSKANSAITLNEYQINGTSGTSVSIASTGSTPLQMAAGSGGSEGFLTKSTDGKFLVLAGYKTTASAGSVTDITSSTSSSTPRAVAKIDASGNYTQIGSTTSYYSANDIRSAVSDGTNYWAGGAGTTTDGVLYFSPGTQVVFGSGATPAKPYAMQIFNSNIYYSSQKAGPNNTASNLGVFLVGSNSPTSGTPTITQIINTGTATPTDFSFSNDGKTCYLAINSNDANGGIQKWTNSTAWATSGWTKQYTLGTGVTNIGAFGLTVDYSGSNAIIYATTMELNTAGNRIIKITDSGSSSSATTLVTGSANTWFHGIAFAPCNAPSSASLSSNSAICAGSNLNLTSSASGSSPFTYAWTGPNSFTSTSQNPSITAATTAATGTYNLTITNGCGTVSGSTSVTVNASPTSFDVTGGGSYCENGSGVLVGLSGSVSGVSYQLKNGTNAVGSAVAGTGNSISFGLQTTAATYTVVGTSNGCSTTMNGSATASITSNVTPSVSISSSNGTTICSGSSLTFTASPSNGGSSPSYQWKVNGNNVGSNSAMYTTSSLSNNDKITCILTSSLSCVNSASATSNELTISVTNSVTPSVSIALGNGDTQYHCKNSSVQIFASQLNGGSSPSFEWYVNNVKVNGQTTSTFSSSSLNNSDVVKCVLTSNDACASVATATSNSYEVIIYDNVTPTLSIEASATTICTGTNISFNANISNGGSTPTYQWKLNGNNVGSNANSFASSSLTNNDKITCVLTSNYECLNSASANSNEISITVKSIPTPSISGTLSFCSGNSTTLDAGNDYQSYTWSTGETTQTVNKSSVASIYVTVSNGTCEGVSSTVNLTVNSVPSQPTFTTSSSSITKGQTGVSYVVSSDVNAGSYVWSFSGSNATINGTSNSVTIDFASNATSGTLDVYASNTCGNSTSRSMSISANDPTNFTAGRLVLVKTTGAVAKAGSPITLQEITTSGSLGTTLNLASTGSNAIQIAAGSGGSEGFLTRSSDGKTLVLAGYNTSSTYATDITVTTGSAAPRSIYKVDASGTMSLVYSNTTGYTGNDIRGAISDGTNYWAAGASNTNADGINYYGPSTPVALGVNSKGYGLRIFNNQIYFSTQKVIVGSTPNFGIYSLGTGLPTSGTLTPVKIINTGSATPTDFSFNPTNTICYVAINMNTSAGGIQKWVKSNDTWSLAYTLGTGTSNIGAYALTVDYSSTNPVIYATTFEANTAGNRVIKIVDAGSSSSASTIVTATANSFYHGIDFAPSSDCSLPSQPSSFTASSSSPYKGQKSVTYTVPNVAGVTYTWAYSGSGATINGSGNSITIDFSITATSGTLTVVASNACGNSSARTIDLTLTTMPGAIRITEYMYNAGGTSGVGEYVELTNVGGASVDMTGWSFDDNSRSAGSQSLSGFGTIQPGESVILTDISAGTFKTNWNLCSGVKVIGGNANNLGREDEINIYDASNTLVDRLTYGDQTYSAGSIRTTLVSGYVSASGIGNNTITQWSLSSVSDVEGSYASTLNEVGSPGKSARVLVTYDPCTVINNAPTIALDVTNTSNYIDGGVGTSPSSPFAASAVLSDPTDPLKTLGISFTINDSETAASSLVVSATSSNSSAVNVSNLVFSGSGSTRLLKITPSAVGRSTITVSVSDGLYSTSYVISYAVSAASLSPSNTTWSTGMSDASDGIRIDDNYFISGDDELDVLNVYSRANSGLPVVSYDYASSLALPDPSKPEVDLEAGTPSAKIGNRIYWLGSMSNGKAPFDNKPNRNRIFATSISNTGASTSFSFVGYYGSLRERLISWGDANGYNFTASAAAGVDSKSVSGFAAEGMVFGPDSTTLYIAMRAPLVPTSTRDKAVIAPISNFETWFNNGSPVGSPTFANPIELDLGGRGFRDLIRLSNGTYVIVAGDPGPDAKSTLYKWTGVASDAPIRVNTYADGVLNMEGAVEIKSNGKTSLSSIQIISDGGDDILYNDAIEAKSLSDLSLRKFRSDVITSIDLCMPTKSTLTASACNSYAWFGTTYTNSGSYTHTLNNAAGCDSVITLNLTIKTGSTNTVTASACNSYTWFGTTYTNSGSYTHTLNNAVGCDSVITLNLTIKAGSTNTVTASACNSYTWFGTTYTNSGSYTHTLNNASDCDSVITLNLTIKAGSTNTVTASACNTYTWFGTTYTNSGSYTHTLINAAGCDSVITLNLTIKTGSTNTITASACNSYAWFGTTYTNSGSYTHTLNNAAGCDSVITLNLTIKNSSTSTSTVTSTNGYTWNGTTYTQSGTYQYTTLNARGCDSIATLNLTVNNTYPTSIRPVYCGGMVTTFSSSISAVSVKNATAYKFKVSDGDNIEYVEKTTPSFNFAMLSSKKYATTYTIQVAAKLNGLWTGYSNECSITTPDYPTSKVKATQCNTTIAALSTTIGLDAAVSATGYRVKLTNGEVTETIDKLTNSFKLTDFTNKPFYGTAYSIEVAPMFTDSVVGYGTSCTVTTPTVVSGIQSAYCDNVLSLITSTFKANTITGAQAYRFIVSNGINTDSLESTSTSMSLSKFSDINLKSYGTQYSVSVRYKLNNVWLPKGPSCSISTPTMPLGISTATCTFGAFTASTKLVANSVTNATKYKFLLTYNGQRIDSVTTTSASVTGSSFKKTTGKVIGRNYGLQVAVEYKGVFTSYSEICALTYVSPLGLSRSAMNEIEVKVYPNPFHEGIVFESNEQSEITVKVFDMTGRNVSNHTGTISELNQIKIGNDFTPGVYQIQIENEQFSRSIRMIKE